ncbi:DUF5985 family protein [Noviluteimonas dokdonensis]|nr:DUF5985 family protein [Lysobacter dokdonensis]
MLGMISMGCAVAALLFLRFWRTSRDRFFVFFAAAFAIEAVNRAVFAYIGPGASEYQLGYVLARLVAFALILVAILDKNTRRG